ncbi:Hypothetical predicted protein [Paramuricea clavata]|uniref:Uncharacterized protein n=1 Tax=Paramuricea clavata TaxID=317549 RepID=A0A6S7IL15_PARCT|nr:Hypothetical predicted protein [Paramuricea clavata]
MNIFLTNCQANNERIDRAVHVIPPIHQLNTLKWDAVNHELKDRCPLFYKFLTASVSNPSHARNIHKKGEAILPQMLDAGCQLISIFNSDLDAIKRVKSVVLKKGSLKKWKEEVERGVKMEKDVLESLQQAEAANNNDLIEECRSTLDAHREIMHPGYSFTGDNVDINCSTRQMILTNRTRTIICFSWWPLRTGFLPITFLQMLPMQTLRKYCFLHLFPVLKNKRP